MSSLFARFLNRPVLQPAADAAATVPAEAPADAAAPAAEAPAAAVPAAAAAVVNPGLVSDFLFEDQVSTEKVLSLFRQAYFQVEVMSEHRLRLVMDFGMRLSVTVDADRKLITYSTSYSLREDAPMEAKVAFVNRVNDGVIFVRFAVHDATTLWIDYQLPFDGGVASAAVIGALRRYARIAYQSIGQYDTDRVVG